MGGAILNRPLAGRLSWLLVAALEACTQARACVTVDPDPPAPRPAPPSCAGEVCQDIHEYCNVLLKSCELYEEVEADAGIAHCESVTFAKLAEIAELVPAARELAACANAEAGCSSNNCVEYVRAKYKSAPKQTDAGIRVTVRNASVLPGDRLDCVRCAHEHCAEVAGPCFGEFDAAIPPTDSCYAYRACVNACTTGFGLTTEQSRCVATECDSVFDVGRTEFARFRRCMTAADHCRRCGAASLADGGTGGPN